MSTDDSIAIIGLVLGASGWLAFGLQYAQNRRDKRLARRGDIERLDELVGQRMAKITEITATNESYEATAARINDFNDDQGGFETNILHALNHLPRGQDFDDIRQKFGQFRTDAFDVKMGLIGDLADQAHPPRDEEERERSRRTALAGLREECADLQTLLRAQM